MTKQAYTIEIESQSGYRESVPLSAKTDRGAKIAARRWVDTTGAVADFPKPAKVYLAYLHDSGATGWLLSWKY